MRIGLDFDNTIADYDAAFVDIGIENGLLPPGFAGDKRAVRDVVRSRPSGERVWQALQGEVYGRRMHKARLMEGCANFLNECRARQVEVFVISHKTEFGHLDRDSVSLRTAARAWMETAGFFEKDGFGLRAENVFFEDSRDHKVARISCTSPMVFVDDLEEVFFHPQFPRSVRAILFRGDHVQPDPLFEVAATWTEIGAKIWS